MQRRTSGRKNPPILATDPAAEGNPARMNYILSPRGNGLDTESLTEVKWRRHCWVNSLCTCSRAKREDVLIIIYIYIEREKLREK